MKCPSARIVTLLAVLGIAVMAAFTVVDAHWSNKSALAAREVVGRVATSLDLKFSDFTGPEVTDPGFFGSKTYEWERLANNRALERLVYDPWEQNVCWSREENGTWKGLGCISAK